eukprot:TRINITY_DN6471_c0_g1_i1.p1 TRINITY_DN6471_c0_g1~~TRINITY_DN6471_c0_g1_i1.p1  ORF type:complete len:286 (+),score=51.05 TRINITY_DN6471_c0_g1_i1:290-1147(+)
MSSAVLSSRGTVRTDPLTSGPTTSTTTSGSALMDWLQTLPASPPPGSVVSAPQSAVGAASAVTSARGSGTRIPSSVSSGMSISALVAARQRLAKLQSLLACVALLAILVMLMLDLGCQPSSPSAAARLAWSRRGTPSHRLVHPRTKSAVPWDHVPVRGVMAVPSAAELTTPADAIPHGGQWTAYARAAPPIGPAAVVLAVLGLLAPNGGYLLTALEHIAQSATARRSVVRIAAAQGFAAVAVLAAALVAIPAPPPPPLLLLLQPPPPPATAGPAFAAIGDEGRSP